LAPRLSLLDSPTTLIGFNHIGISVLDTDGMLQFYQSATNFELISRFTIRNNKAANILFGVDSIAYETAILKGPNMLFELTAFEGQFDTIISIMPPHGPDMTHICYQGPLDKSVYNKFKNVGAKILSWGDGASW